MGMMLSVMELRVSSPKYAGDMRSRRAEEDVRSSNSIPTADRYEAMRLDPSQVGNTCCRTGMMTATMSSERRWLPEYVCLGYILGLLTVDSSTRERKLRIWRR
jgi:hypothetical protein